MAISSSFGSTSLTPTSADSTRVAPPESTLLTFEIPKLRQSSAISSMRSARVTTTISATSGQASKVRSVLASTGMPPSSAVSLSLPKRSELPAATITAEQRGSFSFSRKRSVIFLTLSSFISYPFSWRER